MLYFPSAVSWPRRSGTTEAAAAVSSRADVESNRHTQREKEIGREK